MKKILFVSVLSILVINPEFAREKSLDEAVDDMVSQHLQGDPIKVFHSHDPLARVDLDLIAPLPSGKGNAAKEYCLFMENYQNSHEISVHLNGEEKTAYDTNSPEFQHISNALGKMRCRLTSPEDYNPPFWLEHFTVEKAGYPWCDEWNFLGVLKVGKGIVAKGERLSNHKRLTEALQTYRAVVVMGRHLREENSFHLMDRLGAALIGMGAKAMVALLESHPKLQSGEPDLLPNCRSCVDAWEECKRQEWARLGLMRSLPTDLTVESFWILQPALAHESPSIRLETLLEVAHARFSTSDQVKKQAERVLNEALTDSDQRVRSLASWGLNLTLPEAKKLWSEDD